jgi:hypothetical protein
LIGSFHSGAFSLAVGFFSQHSASDHFAQRGVATHQACHPRFAQNQLRQFQLQFGVALQELGQFLQAERA